MRSPFGIYARLTQAIAPHRQPLQRLCTHYHFPRSCTTLALQNEEDEDMGKDKVQFQLKTPKGTKDCKYLPFCVVIPLLILHRGGKGHGNPRSNILNHNHRLQAPRRSNDRYVRQSVHDDLPIRHGLTPIQSRLRAPRNSLGQIWRRQQTHLRPGRPRRRDLLPPLRPHCPLRPLASPESSSAEHKTISYCQSLQERSACHDQRTNAGILPVRF